MAKAPLEVYTTSLPDAAVSFDIPAFDRLIESQGVTFVHWRAMRCPVGLVDQYDIRRPHEDHEGCSNGFVYTCAGKIKAAFTGNSNAPNFSGTGILNGASVSVTMDRFYDGTREPIYISAFDRLYLDEENIAVVNWQLFEASATGRERLNFPVVQVQDLIDTDGTRYSGADFEVIGGQVCWLTQRRPGADPTTGKGRVCSIRYTYRPYWYVKQLIHEVRVAQAENPATGIREIMRLPQAALLQREYVFEDEEKDSRAPDPDSARQVKSPPSGSFGPR